MSCERSVPCDLSGGARRGSFIAPGYYMACACVTQSSHLKDFLLLGEYNVIVVEDGRWNWTIDVVEYIQVHCPLYLRNMRGSCVCSCYESSNYAPSLTVMGYLISSFMQI